MCVGLWYFMGFATEKFIVEVAVGKMTKEMLYFWQDFYDNILLEYYYINKISSRVTIVADLSDSTALDDKQIFRNDLNVIRDQTIIPIGGGKDSLVAWHLCRIQGKIPTLLYVADGPYEFEGNWRLQQLVYETGDSLHIFRHNFDCNRFERRAR